jgi:hypothetical protein
MWAFAEEKIIESKEELVKKEEQFNNNENFLIEKKYGEYFLSKFNYSEDLSDPIPLYNLENNIEAVVFSLKNKDADGYIIINTNDLSIPEFSLSKSNPFTTGVYDKCIYNGPLEYYNKKDGKITTIYDNKQIDLNNIKLVYSKKPIDKLEKFENEKNLIKPKKPTETYEELKGSLRTWGTSHYCGVDGTAILLMYFDDYYDESFVKTSLESANALTNHLVNNRYIPDKGTVSTEIKSGIEDYLNDRGLGNDYDVSRRTYNFSSIKQKIKQDKPVLVGTVSHPDFGDHWIIAHAYYEDDFGDDYIIVNDGWGSNDVYVANNSTYYDYLVYIY